MRAEYKTLLQTSTWWNATESLYYESLLVVYKILLCRAIGLTQFSQISIAIAAIYLIGMVTNVGLYLSLPAFFKYARTSKYHFRRIVGSQLLLQLFLFMLTGAIALSMPSFIHSFFPHVPLSSKALILLIWATAASEGIKRTVRYLLKFSFYNATTSITEMILITAYIVSTWLYVFYTHTLSVAQACGALLACSASALFFLLAVLFSFYRSLPEQHDEPLPERITARIISSRFFNTINQWLSQLLCRFIKLIKNPSTPTP